MIPILFDHDEINFTSQGICRLSDAVDCFVTEEINGIYECELKYPIDGLYFDEILPGRLIGATHDDNGDIQPYEIYKYSAPIDGVVTFYAHHISYRLRNHILTPFHASSCTEAMSVMAAKSINLCPFQFWTDVGTIGSFDVNYPISIKEMLAGNEGSILNLYGPGEFEFDKWTVKFHSSRGSDHGVEIRYGKNLTDLTHEYDSSEVYTAVIPYWYKEDADGISHLVMLDGEVIYTEAGLRYAYWTDEFGNIITNEQGEPIEFATANIVYSTLDLSSEFDEEPTQAELAAAARQVFDSSRAWEVNDSISISFVSLWQTPEYENIAPLEKVSLGDLVHVIHTRIGVSSLAEVVKTNYNVLLDRFNSVELGSPQVSLARSLLGDTQSTIKKIQEVLKRTTTADYVNEQLEAATDAITGGLGGYIKVTLNADNEPQEILVLDKPNIEQAVKVIRINQNGIGFSTTGYQGPFNSAWLIDGTFDAQVINVVNLAATVIRTGFLTDSFGDNYWNLETGEFRLSSALKIDTFKEESFIATRAYTIGQYIEIAGGTYEVTQAIPINGQIQVGANVKASNSHTLLDYARRTEIIETVDVEYASHTSNETPPPQSSSAWQTTSPVWESGKYIWQRTKTIDGNGIVHYSTPACIQGAQGEQGDTGVGVSAIEEQYYLSTSKTEQIGSSWSTTPPAYQSNTYIWTRSKVTWTDGTVTYTSPVLANPLNGLNEILNGDNAQQEIFKRLTNNSQNEGVYLYNGRLYLNATMMATGTIQDQSSNPRNYWNLNTGYFQTTAGKIAGFTIGTSYIGDGANTTFTDIFYLASGTTWGKPYSAANTPISGVGIRGASNGTNTGYNIISQGPMFINNLDYYAGRVRLNAGLMMFDVGLTPSDPSSSWSVVAVINPFASSSARGININGSLAVSGSKSRIVKTESYHNRLLYCYEMPSPMFGDLGEGILDDTGLCYIWLDPIFAQTIEDVQYQVFLQSYGNGNCYVKEKHTNYFVVAGDPNLSFGWELKAKQLDHSMVRLGDMSFDDSIANSQDTLKDEVDEYFKSLREGRSN